MNEFCHETSLFKSIENVSLSNQPHLKKIFSNFLDITPEKWNSSTNDEALCILAKGLFEKDLVVILVKYFRCHIPSAVSNGLGMNFTHQKKCLLLANTINLHPDVLKLALVYYEAHEPPWADPNWNSPKRRKLQPTESMDLDIVHCCWKLIRTASDKFRRLWDWSTFIEKYISHPNREIFWVASQAIVLVLSLSENQKSTFMKNHFTEDEILTFTLRYQDILFSDEQDSTISECTDYHEDVSTSMDKIEKKEPSTINVCGISLLREDDAEDERKDDMVMVESTRRNLQKIAVGVAIGRAVCLAGLVGSGKTALIDHLSCITGRKSKLLKVQLGEEIDSKMLLGSYRCTDLPGEFVWQPGVLTTAVMEGRWLLLEDIDSATSDVAAVIASMIENNSLSVPGFKENITPSSGFHLFMTYRLFHGVQGQYRKSTSATELVEKHWHLVELDTLSDEELINIIKSKFPVLNTVAPKMVAAYNLFSRQYKESQSDFVYQLKNDRLISTRDLMKWCARAQVDFDVSSQSSALKILQDAIDLFCSSYSDPGVRLELAGRVASCLGIIKTKAEYFCTLHHPNISLTEQVCQAGRATLLRDRTLQAASLDSMRKELKFAMTQESSCLLEKVGVCLSLGEPVLLVGETGTGKTTTLQLLASYTGSKLVIINMNQQSDSADLLGGYKPVDLKFVISPLRDTFEQLFRAFFDVEKNIKFLENISVCFSQGRWKTLVKLMKQSQMAAVKRLTDDVTGDPSHLLPQWLSVGEKISRLEIQLTQGRAAMAFSFIQGSLITAIKNGYWVLLDEINLASAETLQCLSSLLESIDGSVSLLETGDFTQIRKHPDFRLLAAMNPATDIGKKDLPPGIRNRFTELFVPEHTDAKDLSLVVQCYLPDLPAPRIEAIVRFYLSVRALAAKSLSDTTGHKPHFSLRSLCRALVVGRANLCGSMDRSLFEALCLSFLSQLDTPSHTIVTQMIAKAIVGNKVDLKSIIGQTIPEPLPAGGWSQFEGYWIRKGTCESEISDKYLLTGSVRRNLSDLARIVSLSSHPVLIQGETSVGKTSLVTWLAKASGHPCLRINNHQHTDLQEYIGTYVPHPETGCLFFSEGVLVEAMKKGYWIILDELNLAPSEVLEALNRVLDDNRELFIAETQTLVRAHPDFRLFATQNPPGLYGGRKVLSRAFRNRFVELHFDTIPAPELEEILKHRCDLPLSYCKKMVAVMQDLQVRRRGSAAFAGKQGYITLRDLFRWGERYRLARNIPSDKFYDWDQHIADEGYLVLAGRVRKFEESETIREVLEKRLKRKVVLDHLFTLSPSTSPVTRHILEKLTASLPNDFKHIVWTFNITKIGVLVGKALEFVEPLLLVGETGCGKTTVCQLLAALNHQKLYSVNCHLHSESSDFLGGLRPVRDRESQSSKLFEWVDGPLIDSMRLGGFFLADEISLADDSVLERLNSLLEPERKLLVSEKGSGQDLEVVADDKFRFIGTMNPGGDYGKKELSPALRNRLTEIWCEGPTSTGDLITIIEHNVRHGLSLCNQEDGSSGIGKNLVEFIHWFKATELGKRVTVSIRDILTWVRFINSSTEESGCNLDVSSAYVHGACLTLLDAIGSSNTSTDNCSALRLFKSSCIKHLLNQIDRAIGRHSVDLNILLEGKEDSSFHIVNTDNHFGIQPFLIQKGPEARGLDEPGFMFEAPTTRLNSLRIMRSLQIPGRAILLEGNPGVGKTSLVTALAQATSHKVTRINLSEQTDISDLFGADLPVEGSVGGTFAWRDGPFLKALKQGHWILLDELNLASQSVVEGLNSVLDHRGEIFIPELGKSFEIKQRETRIFACQNPQRQGGSRKGLPQSFLNRFTQVFMEPLTKEDLETILLGLNSSLSKNLASKMVDFCWHLSNINTWTGGPWEWNLRDLNFWVQSMASDDPGTHVSTVFASRMRNLQDRQKVLDLYCEVFGDEYPLVKESPSLVVSKSHVQLGGVKLPRVIGSYPNSQNESSSDFITANGLECHIAESNENLLVLRSQLPHLASLALCVEKNWMPILIGGGQSGKSSLVHTLSHLIGRKLHTLPVNSAMDTTELLGAFEQADLGRELERLERWSEKKVLSRIQELMLVDVPRATRLLSLHHQTFHTLQLKESDSQTLKKAEEEFRTRLTLLISILDQVPEGEVLIGKLRELEVKFNRRGLKSGGTFEWVDSLLVKCLEEGHWLLVDNVNLCPGSVLDRLNGLLEPGGVLVIGERGVSADGNEVTIKPHPNFRIFLTMDPRYGDISRAMRNRGIEIFVDTPNLSTLPPLDLHSILYHIGFKQYQHRASLIDIHSKLSLSSQGFEEGAMSKLYYASSLAAERWKRGFPLDESIEEAFSTVYLRGNAMASRDLRSSLKFTLGEALSLHRQTLLDNVISIKDALPYSSLTLQSYYLQTDSTLSSVRQQSSLIISFIKAFEYNPRGFYRLVVKDILGSELACEKSTQQDFAIFDALHFALISFYILSTPHDAVLRHSLLDAYIDNIDPQEKSNKFFQIILTLSQILRDIVISEVPDGDVPWDMRRFCGSSDGPDSRAWARQNKILILMYYKVVMMLNPNEVQAESLDWKTISIMQYSQTVKRGELTDTLQSHPLNTLICEISSLVSEFNSVLLSGLKCSETYLDIAHSCALLYTVAWKFRLENAANRRLFITKGGSSVQRSLSDTSISQLLLHYKWFSKHTLPILLHFIYTSKIMKKKSIDMIKTIEKIVESLEGESMELVSLSKRFTRDMNPPHPACSARQCHLGKILHKLEVDFGVGSLQRGCDFLTLLKLVSTHKSSEIRRNLLIASKLIHENTDLDHAEELLQGVENEITSLKDQFESMDDPVLDVNRMSETKIWPLLDWFGLHLGSLLRRKLGSKNSNDTWLEPCGSWISLSSSLCPSYSSCLDQAIERSKIGSSEELIKSKYVLNYYMTHSTALRNPFKWINSSNASLQELVPSTLEMASSQHLPMLSVMVSSLLTEVTDKSSGLASLGSHRNLTQLLKKIKLILWKNSPFIFSPQLDFLRNEVEGFKNSLKHMVISLLKALTKSSENIDNLMDAMNTILEHFKGLKSHIDLRKSRSKSIDPGSVEQIITSLMELKEIVCELDRLDLGSEDKWSLIGRGWLFLGQAQLVIFSSLDSVDPVQKKSLKSEYAREELRTLGILMSIDEVYKTLIGFTGQWPFENEHRLRMDYLRKKLDKLSKDVAVRPYPPVYHDILKDLSVVTESICRFETVKSLSERLSCDKANEKDSSVLTEAYGWLTSVESWIDNITSLYFVTYPDIVIPPLLSLTNMNHGLRILSSMFLKSSVKKKCKGNSIENCLISLSKFPITSVGTAINLLDVCNTSNITLLLEQASEFKCSNTSTAISSSVINHKIRLAKSWLHLVRSLSGLCRWEETKTNFHSILDNVVSTWEIQMKKEEERRQQEDSIYVYKKQLTEEEEDKLEIAELFPTFRETDFGDLEENLTLEDTCKSKESSVPHKKVSLTNQDIEDICNLHSTIVRENVDTHWMAGIKTTDYYNDYIGCLEERLQLFHDTIVGSHLACPNGLDRNAFTSIYLSVELPSSKSILSLEKSEKLYDFYRDPNVDEVRKCLPLLEVINKRVTELKSEWTDHPTLNKMLEIISRIRGFEASSPLIRFLTGVELLLIQVYMWEENAHKGVSLAQHASSLIQQIIEWRKLELHSWKGALHAASLRLVSKASKWWFYLYSLIRDYLDKPMTSAGGNLGEIISSLEMFMERSTLGEYSTRLQLLFTFHCHCTLLPQSTQQKNLCHILWNLFTYYHQFSQPVMNQIRDLSLLIEKKIKDFVKIARWNDINYWSVKSSGEKTHRTLHKHIKEFEHVLQLPVNSAMTKPDIVNDKKPKKVVIKNYISPLSLPSISDEEKLELFQGSIDYVRKSQKLCKTTIVKCQYPKLILKLDQYITDVTDVGLILDHCEVDPNLPKDKRKSAAKSLLQKKRKALSDLFKSLGESGLSYRSGLVKPTDLKEFISMDPINIHIAIKHFSRRSCDSEWFSSWTNAERLVMSAIASCSLLNSVVVKPHQDLSPQNIDRIRGFTFQLLGICFNEKKTLIDFTKDYYVTRSFCENTHRLCGMNVPTNPEKCIALKEKLKDVTNECIYCLDQFRIILDSCPEKPQSVAEVETIPCIISYDETHTVSYKYDPTWESVKTKLDNSLSAVKKIKESIETFEKYFLIINNLSNSIPFRDSTKYLDDMLVVSEFPYIIQGYTSLSNVKVLVSDIVSVFEISYENDKFHNPLTQCLDNVIQNIDDALMKFNEEKDSLDILNGDKNSDDQSNEFKIRAGTFSKKILFIVQEVYKLITSDKDIENEKSEGSIEKIEEKDKVDETKDSEGYESIEEGHIKEKLIESFSSVLSVFRINEINNDISDLIMTIGSETDHHIKSTYIGLLAQCLPLLDQLTYIYQYIIVQKTNSIKALAKLTFTLSTLFTNFSKKGFNIPEELLCDAEGQEGDQNAKGGMGLGDGEGEKDVSDQIESQDQLDDAKRPEDYENPPEDKDCKEEEKGIEVSEDFGGKPQDLEKKEGEEGDDENENEGEEDADKEMGETDKAADMLDQQVWGGESDEEEEGELPEDERGDKGAQQGDKEMGAKDDSKKATEEQKPGPPDDKKKEINEMKDSEMDDDQIDPYYGKHQAYPEVEPLDLEDDLNLDNEEGGKDQDDGDADMENPFEEERDNEKVEEPLLPDGETEEDKETKESGKDNEDSSDSDGEGGNETAADMASHDDENKEEDGEENEDEGQLEQDKGRMELDEEEEAVPPESTEEAVGSEDKPSDSAAEASQQTYGSRDQVKEGEVGESCQEETTAQGEEQEGVGTAEAAQESGGHQGKAGKGKRKGDKAEEEQKRSKPGQSDVDRTLGEFSEPVKKKLKTIGTKETEPEDQKEGEEKEGAVDDENADFYQHIREAKGHQHDAQTIDAATQEQAEKQPVINKEEEDGEELKEGEEPMELDEDDLNADTKIAEMKPDNMEDSESKDKDKDKRKGEGRGDVLEEGTVEVEGDYIETMTVARGNESSYHTSQLDSSEFPCLDESRIQSMRQQLENQLASWNQTPGSAEAISAWENLCTLTEELARQLSQELRLVLEPTTASSLKGDFRTGRRINMRKVIPYIASQFRKDKIWLRRTKPSKREYQIILAIDDSSSMADNHSKELAFESLALVSKALGLLEAGDLSIVSFGETIKVLHRLGETFDQHSGARLVQEFSFEQKRTRVGALVEFAIAQMSHAHRRTDARLAQLLVIVSDGRGVTSEGEESVRSAVRTAIAGNIFIVFLIIDNPTSKDSILDIRMPKFSGGKLLGISSYMDCFPFPFYVILRDINSLPTVLSDALRQWFELVTSSS